MQSASISTCKINTPFSETSRLAWPDYNNYPEYRVVRNGITIILGDGHHSDFPCHLKEALRSLKSSGFPHTIQQWLQRSLKLALLGCIMPSGDHSVLILKGQLNERLVFTSQSTSAPLQRRYRCFSPGTSCVHYRGCQSPQALSGQRIHPPGACTLWCTSPEVRGTMTRR